MGVFRVKGNDLRPAGSLSPWSSREHINDWTSLYPDLLGSDAVASNRLKKRSKGSDSQRIKTE
jgi:hypothetical protein